MFWKNTGQNSKWHKTGKHPVETVQATILKKESYEDFPRRIPRYSSRHVTVYIITFRTESDTQLRLQAPGPLYGMLAEDDYGKLTYQDSRCLSFDLQKLPPEPEPTH